MVNFYGTLNLISGEEIVTKAEKVNSEKLIDTEQID
jgi:hypothetical protein